ncbi:hypothetical protein [Neobacillus fumarioli]|uniref:hypothetical protein n=1 Tax=Neobacillus fumarioli TaxID=105229 RepID=UPI000835C87C|nr:hypothetical protein [Neobacillus fumarioli]
MFAVSFLENKNVLLLQLLIRIPSVGEELKIKGRKAKVLKVENVDDKKVHVQVALEAVAKKDMKLVDQSKRKKR